MPLIKGTNSYVTVAEADAYFENRLDVAAWTNANSTQKSQALMTATSMLDNITWVGFVVSESQTLAFPRSGIYYDPFLGMSKALDETTVPNRIINATYELAYHLLNNDGLLDDTGQVKDLSVGSINLTLITNPRKIPNTVDKLIKPLKLDGGSNFWWRAN